MHRALLGTAALVAASIAVSPAAAQSFAGSGFSSMAGSTHIHRGGDRRAFRIDFRQPGFGGGHRRHIHVDDGLAGAGYYTSGYNDYGDYDANRSFDPDKWNDWWHERPERAFPRWMSRNQDCSRRWYSGDVLTC